MVKKNKKYGTFLRNSTLLYIEGYFIGLVYNYWGDEMGKRKITKLHCKLHTRGTEQANSNAIDDLAVKDPDKTIGKKQLDDLFAEEQDDEDKSDID